MQKIERQRKKSAEQDYYENMKKLYREQSSTPVSTNDVSHSHNLQHIGKEDSFEQDCETDTRSML